MSKHKKRFASKIGLPPGSLVFVGDIKREKVTVSEMTFSPESIQEKTIDNIERIKVPDNEEKTNWFEVQGLHDPEIIELIGNKFSLDKLVLEDILNTTTRPVCENFDSNLFLSFKVLKVDEEKDIVHAEQFSLVLGQSWLLTFHETEPDIFEGFKDRIRQSKGIIRQRNEDYIFYRLIDIAIDNYFKVTELIDDKIDDLETNILQNTDKVSNEEIYRLKKLIGQQKKSIVPVREILSSLIRIDSGLISEDTQKYLRDVYEHLVQIIDTIERQRETVNDLLNLFMSGLSNKMNEVMKVLTIFASIFIPLTFIAGIYGMNFEIMPELSWQYGYFLVWGIMLVVAGALLFYFRKTPGKTPCDPL